MAITANINTIWTEKEQAGDFFTARAALEHATNTISEELAKFKAIKDSGSFNTIPQDLKDAMLAWEAIYDDAKAAFLANADVQVIHNWRP